MKGLYVKPMAFEERFIANEYVAACYKLGCSIYANGACSYGDHWKTESGATIQGGPNVREYHHSGDCQNPVKNRIETDSNGVITSVQENNSQQGWLDGSLDYWVDVNNDGKCNTGDVIYWHTISGDRTRQWNHWGVATGDGSGNHS